MKNPSIKKIAENLIHYSVDLRKGENVLIEVFDSGEEYRWKILNILTRSWKTMRYQSRQLRYGRRVRERTIIF